MSLKSETAFGLSLLSHTPSDESVVLSPLSVSLALALVHAGANGETKDQIRKALAKDASDEELVQHFKTVGEALLKDSDVLVRIANRMFIRENFQVNPSYLENIAKNFAAKAESLDFDKVNDCVEHVNNFVKEVTNDKITDLVDAESFEPEAKAMLINAIYFEAEWANFFSTGNIHERDFHVRSGVTVKVEYLTHEGEISYAGYKKTNEVEVLSIAYRGHDYHFNYTIPKFKVEDKMNLTEVLKSIGITEMFSMEGDLGGIAPGLFVKEARHKAMIEVTEYGTVAASATVIERMCGFCGSEEKPKKIKADRPFLFTITYDSHVLFLGQFNPDPNPSAVQLTPSQSTTSEDTANGKKRNSCKVQ